MQRLKERKASSLDILGKQGSRFKDAAQQAYDESKPDWHKGHFAVRTEQDLDTHATMFDSMVGTHPTYTRAKQILGISDPVQDKVLDEMGMGLKSDPVELAGQMVGSVGADLTQDISRAVWWLVNAPQATGNIINEQVLATANPRLYGASLVKDPRTNKTIMVDQEDLAIEAGLLDAHSGRMQPGVELRHLDDGGTAYSKRDYPGGAVTALGIPAGLAINAGIGLMTPFGGAEGYEAVMPDPEDPSKTSNVLGEIAAKYILGRTGNLLPYDEFKKVRPDVSKGEYNAYKAFKWDKNLDYDPSDGDMNLLPAGVLKATTDGIHGPEVQFLGRSLGLNQTILPFASAVAGAAAGVRRGRPIRSGFLGGMGGLAAGSVTGNLIENERRRRNGVANEAAMQRDQQAKLPNPLDPKLDRL